MDTAIQNMTKHVEKLSLSESHLKLARLKINDVLSSSEIMDLDLSVPMLVVSVHEKKKTGLKRYGLFVPDISSDCIYNVLSSELGYISPGLTLPYRDIDHTDDINKALIGMNSISHMTSNEAYILYLTGTKSVLIETLKKLLYEIRYKLTMSLSGITKKLPEIEKAELG